MDLLQLISTNNITINLRPDGPKFYKLRVSVRYETSIIYEEITITKELLEDSQSLPIPVLLCTQCVLDVLKKKEQCLTSTT